MPLFSHTHFPSFCSSLRELMEPIPQPWISWPHARSDHFIKFRPQLVLCRTLVIYLLLLRGKVPGRSADTNDPRMPRPKLDAQGRMVSGQHEFRLSTQLFFPGTQPMLMLTHPTLRTCIWRRTSSTLSPMGKLALSEVK